MLKEIMSYMRDNVSNDSEDTRRKYPRRGEDTCVAVIDGMTFPVTNWSLGGALIDADNRFFAVGQAIDLSLKFKLRNAIHNVEHKGKIIRKNSGQIALTFEPLLMTTRKAFQKVIDDSVAEEFANSQV